MKTRIWTDDFLDGDCERLSNVLISLKVVDSSVHLTRLHAYLFLRITAVAYTLSLCCLLALFVLSNRYLNPCYIPRAEQTWVSEA